MATGGNMQARQTPQPIVADGDAGRFAPLYCPHCTARGLIRSSKQVTGQHRDMYYQCSNIACGHTWHASLSYDYGIVPSAIPDPRVNLPLRQMSRQQALDAMRERDPDQPDMFDANSDPPPEANNENTAG